MIAKINIEGEIGVECKLMDVIAQMKKYKDPTEMEVRIKSKGGYVNHGKEIYDYLDSFKIPKTTIADGVCASVATRFMLLGSIRKVVDGTKFMIHNPFVDNIKGDADKLQSYSNKLREVEDDFLDFYSTELSQPILAIKPLMKREIMLSNEELLTLGFATEIVEGPAKVDELKAVAKLEDYNNHQKQNVMSKKVNAEEQKSLMHKIENLIKNAFNPKAVLEVADSNGNVLIFPELEPEQTPEVGSKVEADNGSYQVDGVIYVVENNEIAEVNDAENMDDENEELAEAKKMIEAKEDELKAMKEQYETVQAKLTEKEKSEKLVMDELEEIKNTVSEWELEDKPNPGIPGKTKKKGDKIIKKKGKIIL